MNNTATARQYTHFPSWTSRMTCGLGARNLSGKITPKMHVTSPPKTQTARTRTQTARTKPGTRSWEEVTSRHPSHPSSLPYDPQFFQNITDDLLAAFYPKKCPTCKILLTKGISTRPYVIRCSKCYHQASRLKDTPLENLRMPQWFFGWCVHESIKLHPRVLTGTQIQRSLGISEKAASMLKRRLQIFASEQMPRIRELSYKETQRNFKKDFLLPTEGTDLSSIANKRKIVHADTVVLFSASQRANKGRKRFKNSGQTASIYLSDKLGGRQIGTLVHVMGTQQGWCLLHSVGNQKANTLGPIIKEHVPRSAVIFTDEGYDWLYRVYRNHRMVNHSLKSKDNRWRFSRERWCRNGVHNQVAEGLNSSLKHAMAGYRYFRPAYSTLYLNEWAFFKNLQYFGFARLARRQTISSGSGDASTRRRQTRVLRHARDAKSANRTDGACVVGLGGIPTSPFWIIPTNQVQRHNLGFVSPRLLM